MAEDSLEARLNCDKCGQPRVIREITLDKPGMMKRTMSEAIEDEHRKQADETSDSEERELHLILAEAQRKYREVGHIEFKLRCLQHPTEIQAYHYPEEFPGAAQLANENFFRCGKCGGPTEIVATKDKGKKTEIRVRCPDHGEGKRSVPTIIFDPLMDPPAIAATPTPTKPVAPKPVVKPVAKPTPVKTVEPVKTKAPTPTPVTTDEMAFCWKCGTKVLRPDSEFCHKCGSSLRGK